MTFEQAVALVESMCADSAIQDSGIRLQEVLRDLIRLSQSSSANPLIVIDAFEIVTVIAQGPEGSDASEDIVWRESVKKMAREVFGQAKEKHENNSENVTQR